MTVVKNTLTRRAAEAAGTEALLALLDGPTAIAFIEADGDMVAVAKALADSARTTKVLAIRGGILDGAPIGEEEVKNLATLPPLDVLRGQVLGAITAPLTTVVGLISAPIRELVGLHSHIGSQIFDDDGFELAAHRVVGFLARPRRQFGKAFEKCRSCTRCPDVFSHQRKDLFP